MLHDDRAMLDNHLRASCSNAPDESVLDILC